MPLPVINSERRSAAVRTETATVATWRQAARNAITRLDAIQAANPAVMTLLQAGGAIQDIAQYVEYLIRVTLSKPD